MLNEKSKNVTGNDGNLCWRCAPPHINSTIERGFRIMKNEEESGKVINEINNA